MVLSLRSTRARVVIISQTKSPLPPENSRHSVRNGALVMPAIGASTTGGHTVCGPMRSAGAVASAVMRTILPYRRDRLGCSVQWLHVYNHLRIKETEQPMPELSRGRRVLVLAICCMSLLIVSLDNTILNVALPAMRRDLHTSISGLQWTIDAYTLVLASLLMLSGSTADRIGRRRIFRTGLVIFTVASGAVQHRPQPGVAGRVPHAAGDRRFDAQPRRDVDHHQRLHRSA